MLKCDMAFTLRQLQYFISVAEEGTVSGAAQSLSISQSAVPDAIKELESDLGVTLFERHRRGLTITHKGHQFYRHAQRILGSVSDARRSFGEEAAAPVGGSLQLGGTLGGAQSCDHRRGAKRVGDPTISDGAIIAPQDGCF